MPQAFIPSTLTNPALQVTIEPAAEPGREVIRILVIGPVHGVERIVADIDDIVKKVRFPDWQRTNAGERLVQKELRRTLLKYKLHTDQELFDKAYGYIRQYY